MNMTVEEIEKKAKSSQPVKHVMVSDDPEQNRKMHERINLAKVIDESCDFYE